MKKIKTLYTFEWTKNRTPIFLGMALITLFIGCLVLGWVSKKSISQVDESQLIFDRANYAETYKTSLENYENDSSIDNYLALNLISQCKDLQEEYKKSDNSKTKPDYLNNLVSDWMSLLATEQGDGLNYYLETKELPEIPETEEKRLLKQAFVGTKKDYLEYEKYKQEKLLSQLQESATTNLTEQEVKTNDLYNTFYLENIELLNLLEAKENLADWEIDVISYLVRSSPFFLVDPVFITEDVFNVDLSLQQEYGTYENYRLKANEENKLKQEQREEFIYELKNNIPPTSEITQVGLIDKVEVTFAQNVSWGMLLTFIIFLAFFSWTIITEHHNGQDRMILTRQYSYKTIWLSKILYFGSLWFILSFYFLIFYSIVALLYHVDLETLFVTTINSKIVTYSFFYYLFENILRLGFIYGIFITLFFMLSISTKSLPLSIIGTVIYLSIGFVLPINLAHDVYLGNNLYLNIGINLVILILLQVGNTLLYQKKG